MLRVLIFRTMITNYFWPAPNHCTTPGVRIRKFSPTKSFPCFCEKSSSAFLWCRRSSAGATQDSMSTAKSRLRPRARRRESASTWSGPCCLWSGCCSMSQGARSAISIHDMAHRKNRWIIWSSSPESPPIFPTKVRSWCVITASTPMPIEGRCARQGLNLHILLSLSPILSWHSRPNGRLRLKSSSRNPWWQPRNRGNISEGFYGCFLSTRGPSLFKTYGFVGFGAIQVIFKPLRLLIWMWYSFFLRPLGKIVMDLMEAQKRNFYLSLYPPLSAKNHMADSSSQNGSKTYSLKR